MYLMIEHDKLIIKTALFVIVYLIVHGFLVYFIIKYHQKLKARLFKVQDDSQHYQKELRLLQAKSDHIQKINNQRFYYLNAIFTSVKNGLVLLDNEKKIIVMNPRAQEVFDVDDHVFFEATLLHEKELFKQIDVLIEEVKKTEHLVIKTIDFEGNYYEIFVLEIYEKNSRTVPLGVLISIRDVTQSFKLEQLRQDFVQNVSHEFRTPLTIISSYIETIRMWDDIDESYRQEAFNVIEFELTRLQKILNQLLDISSLSHESSHEVVDVYQLIYEVLPSYRRIAEEKKLKIEVLNSLQEDDRVFVNRLMFLQSITNILENAIKFSYEKTIILIELRSEANEIQISIEDSGPGLSLEHQSKIFDRFYRTDEHRNSKTGGTGLGLAISKEVIESFDGRIQIESSLNIGSKFTIILPKYFEEMRK